MTGYGLTCAFPGLALANLRELRQLFLGGNMLSVGSDRHSAVLVIKMTARLCCHVATYHYSPAVHPQQGSWPVQGHLGDVARALQGSTLSELRLPRNRIHGSLDADAGAALCSMARQSLTVLDATGNAISGSLPACLFGAGDDALAAQPGALHV
jgi:hypothetical protein